MATKSTQEEIIQILEKIKNKRARIVIKHILEHGFITTEELEKDYGYNHPPRAVRDVREVGIPLETYRVRSSDGRSIAAYKFVELSEIRQGRVHGRRTFPKGFSRALYTLNGGKCDICLGKFEARYLQIDHRVPYEVFGDDPVSELDVHDFMLLCGSCNRAKSWSCEHCANWLNDKSYEVCQKCYWGNPSDYHHIALRELRRTDILWEKDEIPPYEKLKSLADQNNTPIPDYVKKIIVECLKFK